MPTPFYRQTTSQRRKVHGDFATSVRCPKCDAPPGVECESEVGDDMRNHWHRVTLAVQRREQDDARREDAQRDEASRARGAAQPKPRPEAEIVAEIVASIRR